MAFFKVSLCKYKIDKPYLQLAKKINIPFLFVAVFTVFCTLDSAAQYTGVINSNRPGFSESPYSVGNGVYQLETSFYLKRGKTVPTFSVPDFSGVNFLFRTSFFLEELEFNIHSAYQNDKVAFKNIFESHYYTQGFSELTIGAKYLVYESIYKDKSKEVRSWKERRRFDWKRLIPSVGVYAGFNIDALNDIHKAGGSSPRFGVFLQNDLTRDLNVITNLYYNKMGTDFSEFSYIISATYSLSDRWSTFFENQGIFNKQRNSTNLGSGIAYLYNRNLQFNSSLRFMAVGESTGYYASIGVSFRIDNHVDKSYELDEKGKRIEEDKGAYKDKSALGKFFGGITGIFKGKKKKQVSVDVQLKDSTVKNIEKNTNPNEDTIYNQNKAEGKPIRTRPKRVRKKPTKIKIIKKKKEKKKKKKKDDDETNDDN